MRRVFNLIAAVAWLSFLPTSLPAAVDFARDIQPILSENCYHCHGPDEKTRKAGLRLDTKEGAFRQRKGRALIVPGKSDKSELIQRVASADPEEVMPPVDSNRKLTAKQIDLLKKWVDEGAVWGQHWAFVPPKRPALPAVKKADWARNDIDCFILARLEREGLTPSPETSREAWLRRVTLDLTGLPPTLAEIDAFLADNGADAHEKVVDRLLASPRYGERLATDWLDVARFADTHGYQMDRARAVWPYRDWVIRAFNRNQPFDQFITWQLAGDLLPNATKEQRLATAFNRLHMQNEEGGIVEEEFRVAYVVDRVNTFSTAFLGMTTECSRCHDHKFDPLTMKDFYQLFAFFQNIDESGQTSYFTAAMPVPTLLLSTEEQDRKLAELAAKIAGKEKALTAEREKARPAFEKWLSARPANQPRDLPGELSIPDLVAAYAFDEFKDNRSPNAADPKTPAQGHEAPKLVPGKVGQAVELNGENGFTFPGVGHFTRVDPFTLGLWLQTPTHAARAVVVHHSMAPIDAGSRGYELLLEKGRVAFALHHMWPGNSLKVVTKAAIPVNTWTHVAVTYDGSSHAAGVRVYLDGKPAELVVIRDDLTKDITYPSEPNLALGHRFRDAGFKGGKVDEFRVYNRALSGVEVAHLAGGKDLTQASRADLFDYFTGALHEPTRNAAEELRKARADHNRFINPIPEIMVMEEMKEPRPAFVLKRGAYDAPGQRVSADTPGVLPPFPPGQPRNRLGLARWLTNPDHPLTARVTVNRVWQMMFGMGLVETSDNFGSTGIPPTHPDLLDYLARDFTINGWDLKRMLKRIALSATYRQSARVTPELLVKDPYNHLLGRAPARRLTAEMLRDQALFASGLLVEKLGGPSVYPYQPEGIWDEAMGRPHYPRSKGEDLYRRGLYTYWKRTAPPPVMLTFDAADRSLCTARRQATSTPLQALALLNDTQMVEAARFLGQRILKEGGPERNAQVAWAFRTVIGRRPTARETAILAQLWAEQREVYGKDDRAAEKLLATGDTRSDPKLDRAELAAVTVLGLAILNHDEAVFRR
jgi:hypothetical protein